MLIRVLGLAELFFKCRNQEVLGRERLVYIFHIFCFDK